MQAGARDAPLSERTAGAAARTRCARSRRCAFLTKEPAHRADESGPGRIAEQEDVIAALERDEPCSGNAAGGGAEYAVSWNLVLKAEYLYVDLGCSSFLETVVVPGTPDLFTANLGRATFHVVRGRDRARFTSLREARGVAA